MGSILNLVYDNNSTISFYQDLMDFYKVDNYHLCALSVIKNINDKYYYIYRTDRYLEPLFNEYGGFPFSEELKSALASHKNLSIIFLNEHESDNENCLSILKEEILKNNLSEKQFYFISNNNKLDDLKIKENTEINVYRINRAPLASIREMSNYPHPFVVDRDYLFMTHNRAIKSHRVALLCMLNNMKLLDETDWSLIRGFEFNQRYFDENGINKWFLKEIFDENDYTKFKNDLEYLKTFDIKKSKFETAEEFDFPPHLLERSVSFKMNCYAHSYINITTETHYESPYLIQISEKTFLPFHFFQIPIFVATVGHVKKVKEVYGYDLFEDIIDHSYDNEQDNKKRMLMIITEIKRLNENKSLIVNFFKKNEYRFIKNREMVLQQLSDKSDYNYFKNLI